MSDDLNRIKELAGLNEGVDPTVQKVADLAKGKTLVNMRKPLEGIFKKKDIDFVMSPIPHFRIKYKGKTLILVHKKYADNADAIEGEIAIGFEGRI